MHVYKELNFIGNKEIFDEMFFKIYDIFPSDWIKPEGNHLLNNYILADYIGNKVPHAEVSIYYGEESGEMVLLEWEYSTIRKRSTFNRRIQ